MSKRTRRIPAVVLATIALAVSVACAPEPPAPPLVPSTRPACPFDGDTVIFGGDSLATQWARWVDLPPSVPSLTTARGGSAFTGNLTSDPDFGTIGSRILDELDDCGDDIGAVVVGGGDVDLSYGASAQELIASIRELDAELHARGVAAVFLQIPPVSNATEWYAAHQTARQAVNGWMSTTGNLHGTAVDCAPALEDTPGSDALARRYWGFIDIFGTVDLVHPNNDAYAAIGTCLLPAVLAAVAN